MADQRLKFDIDGDPSGLTRALGTAGAGLRGLGLQTDSLVSGLGTSSARVTSMVAGMVGLLAGGSLVVGLRNAINAQDQMHESAKRLSMDTAVFSGMAYAAKLSGVEVDQLSKAYTKLQVLLSESRQGDKTARGTLRALGLEDARDAQDLMEGLAEKFAAAKDDIEKTAIATKVFGERIGPQLVPLLNEGREGIRDLMGEAERLGVVFDTHAGQAAADFNDNLDRLTAASQGMFVSLGSDLLPTLNNIAKAMTESASAGGAVSVVGQSIRVVFETVAVLGANVAYMFRQIAADFRTMGSQVAAVAQGELAQAAALGRARVAEAQRARAEVDALSRSLLGLDNGASDPAELARRGRLPSTGGATPLPTATATRAPRSAAQAAPPDSYMAYYEQVLALLRAQHAEENALREMNKTEEAAYWRSLLENYQLTAKDKAAVTLRVKQLEIDAARESAQTQVQLQRDAITQQQQLGELAIEFERQQANELLQTGAITDEQRLQAELAFEERRTALRRTALEQNLQLIDPTRDPVTYQQILNQIEMLEQQHLLRMGQIRDQAVQQTGQQWQGLMQFIGSGMQQLSQSIVQGTFTWRGAFQTAYSMILQASMQTISSLVLNWIKGLLKIQVANKQTSLSNIHASAKEAAAGAYKAMVGIPYVGPFLAPAAAAVAYAGTMAFASAAQGYDIPAGVNPVTQLHQREMVLPAEQADVIRGFAEGASGAAAPTLTLSPIPGGYYAATRDEFVRFFKELQRGHHLA